MRSAPTRTSGSRSRCSRARMRPGRPTAPGSRWQSSSPREGRPRHFLRPSPWFHPTLDLRHHPIHTRDFPAYRPPRPVGKPCPRAGEAALPLTSITWRVSLAWWNGRIAEVPLGPTLAIEPFNRLNLSSLNPESALSHPESSTGDRRRSESRPPRITMTTPDQPVAGPTGGDVSAVAALADDYQRMRDRDRQGDHRPGGRGGGPAHRPAREATCCWSACPGWPRRCSSARSRGSCSLSFRRIQFTPDMMPSDITGTDILQDDPETGRRRFTFIAGPLFANIILADEINRTPPKTQAALLEAMQERHVTRGGDDLSPARPVLRPGDAEPDRAGRDVPAARGPARPVHAQRAGALPDGRRGAGDPPPHDRRRDPRTGGHALGPSRSSRCNTWSGGCRCPTTSSSMPATSSAPAGRTSPKHRPWSRNAYPGAPARAPASR